MTEEQEQIPTQLDHTRVIGGLKWVRGYPEPSKDGLPAETMVIGDHPGPEETRDGSVFRGPSGTKVLWPTCNKLGFDYAPGKAYFTNAVKYEPPGKRAVNAGDIKRCKPVLEDEIERAGPRVIVCLGANALKAIMGRSYTLNEYRGVVLEHPERSGVKVIAAYNPAYVLRNPEAIDIYEEDWRTVVRLQRGQAVEEQDTQYVVLQTADQVRAFKDEMLQQSSPLLSIDCEWNGATWMSPDRYVRLVQIGFKPGYAAVIELYDEGVVPEGELWTPACKRRVMGDEQGAWAAIKELFEYPTVQLMGQNIIADGQWLMSYGIDIRDRVVFDTMLAEHLIRETGPFGLERLTVKYTKLGRYDIPVMRWVKDHKLECVHGYGPVPRDLLIPYGAKDVDAPIRIARKQMPLLAEFMQPRGNYPSLWAIVMQTQRILYEIEGTGQLVDKDRLESLIKTYRDRLTELEGILVTMATDQGLQNFNHRSIYDVRKLLYDTLHLTPIKTTKGKPWKMVMNQSPDQQALHAPAADKVTLEILQEEHPAAKALLNVRRVHTAVKYFLRDDDEADEASSGGGIKAKVWADGRLHPHFSQLSETGRFRTSKPNCQNWPKKVEGEMVEAFGAKEKVPPLIRSIIVPTPGYYLMEADFVQAELFVLAALSGDEHMWEALTTPGKDMHDLTAITSFGLAVLDKDGHPVSEEHILDLAARDRKAFEDYQKTLIYVDQRGKRMSRGEFKNGIRVSAKNLNFGIPYGRGALDIARQVKAETGSKTPIAELQDEIQQMMDVWKTTTYKQAWDFMTTCAAGASDPGYLTNPWGRKRRFTKAQTKEKEAGQEREAQNFPIQSTVADTCMIAMWLMCEYRKQHGLKFRLVNQIHDAIMVEVPEDEVERTRTMFNETMGNIDIPIPHRQPLRLNIDIDVLTRWGQKKKED